MRKLTPADRRDIRSRRRKGAFYAELYAAYPQVTPSAVRYHCRDIIPAERSRPPSLHTRSDARLNIGLAYAMWSMGTRQADIAKAFSVTRQAVCQAFRRRGLREAQQ
jgi:uncharacterized protein (DUF433 family)